MHVGVAGLGKMGSAMVLRLIECGTTVAVWNRTREKSKPLAEAGARVMTSPTALAETSDAVLTILTDAAAIEAVYHGPAGLLAGDVRGKLFIEMSTVQPATQLELAAQVRAQGARFVECPVGGSTGPARQGKLLGFMGGEGTDIERARPLLEQLCRRLEHAGSVGAGTILKYTVNLPLMIYWQALGEALALVRSISFDPDRLMDLLSETSGGPNVLKARGPGVASMLKGGDAGPVTFDVDGGIKDINSMLAQARTLGVDLPLLERTLACYEETKRHFSGSAEVSTVSINWAKHGKR